MKFQHFRIYNARAHSMKLLEGPKRQSELPQGVPPLNTLLKERIIETQGFEDITPENILLTNATYEANFLALSESVGLGDEIVISVPVWYQFAAYMDQTDEYSFCCGGLHPNSKVHLLKRNIEDGCARADASFQPFTLLIFSLIYRDIPFFRKQKKREIFLVS